MLRHAAGILRCTTPSAPGVAEKNSGTWDMTNNATSTFSWGMWPASAVLLPTAFSLKRVSARPTSGLDRESNSSIRRGRSKQELASPALPFGLHIVSGIPECLSRELSKPSRLPGSSAPKRKHDHASFKLVWVIKPQIASSCLVEMQVCRVSCAVCCQSAWLTEYGASTVSAPGQVPQVWPIL